MGELYIPTRHVIKLGLQHEFPKIDLSDDNTKVFKTILTSEEGIEAQGKYLEPFQGYIHLIADYALKMSGIKTRYSEDELTAFSQGFASFETINALVHPPRIYDIQTAQKKVRKLFIPPQLDPFDLQIAQFLEAPDEPVTTGAVFIPEIELAERQATLPQKLPNTFDVIVELGEVNNETMPQIHARTAGAHIAYQLATEDLDAA